MLAGDCKHYITGATKDAGTAGANATTAADVRMSSILQSSIYNGEAEENAYSFFMLFAVGLEPKDQETAEVTVFLKLKVAKLAKQHSGVQTEYRTR
jgi:hypothetical protein